MIKKLFFGSLITVFIFNMAYGAVNPAPLQKLKESSNKMIAMLEKNNVADNEKLVNEIVKQVILPMVDIERAGKMTVGRQFWSAATPGEKKAFFKQFKTLVVSTYSAALYDYDKDEIVFLPIRSFEDDQKNITISSEIIRKSGQKIPITYYMYLNNNKWLVYDFTVEGISLTQSYRSQFAETLQRSGLPGLIEKLKLHNKAS